MTASTIRCLPCALGDPSFLGGQLWLACTQLPLGVLVGEDCALLECIRSAPKRRCELLGRLERVSPGTVRVALVLRAVALGRGSFAAHARFLTSL